MSDRLERAFREAGKLPAREQDAFAEFLLAELEDDREWTRQFISSSEGLAKLADEALAEHKKGLTLPLDDLAS